jgi:hypothetical protein
MRLAVRVRRTPRAVKRRRDDPGKPAMIDLHGRLATAWDVALNAVPGLINVTLIGGSERSARG